MSKDDKNLSRFTYFNKLNITNKTNYYNSRLTLVKQEIARFKDLQIKLQPMDLDSKGFSNLVKDNSLVIGKIFGLIDISNQEFDELIMIDCSITNLIAHNVRINNLILIRTDVSIADWTSAKIQNCLMIDVVGSKSNFKQTNLCTSSKHFGHKRC